MKIPIPLLPGINWFGECLGDGLGLKTLDHAMHEHDMGTSNGDISTTVDDIHPALP